MRGVATGGGGGGAVKGDDGAARDGEVRPATVGAHHGLQDVGSLCKNASRPSFSSLTGPFNLSTL